MATEIERKYLVKMKAWQEAKVNAKHTHISQAYLSLEAERTVRVRIKKEIALLTIKGKTQGVSRLEFEYQIPLNDGLELLKICQGSVIKKKRYILQYDHLIWEVDEFEGDNAGLIVAEVELESEDQSFALPTWIKEEVSEDSRYYNANLVQHPFKDWT
jgi:CYTH domain-containing protein